MENKICQSCGMPMEAAQDFGTNADNTQNQEYCVYCYEKGTFTNDVTMDEMIDNNLKYIDEWNKENGQSLTVEEARPQLRQFLRTLKRWESSEQI